MKKWIGLLSVMALVCCLMPMVGNAEAPTLATHYPVYTMSGIADGTVLPDNYGSSAVGANERAIGDIVTSIVHHGTGMALKWTTKNSRNNYQSGLVYLEPNADASAVTDWSGASDLLVYVDASELTDGVPTVDFRLSTDDNNNTWGLTTGKPVWTQTDGQTAWVEQTVSGNSTHRMITLPAGFRGWVRMPLTSTTWTTAWGGSATGTFTVENKRISRIWVGFGGQSNDNAFVDKSIYFGNFSLGVTSAATAAAPVFNAEAPAAATCYRNGATGLLDLSATQADGLTVRYELTAAPAHGRTTLDVNSGFAVYVPDTNYSGTDTFTLRAYNYGRHTGEATRTVTVTVRDETDPGGASSIGNTAPRFPVCSDWWGVSPRLTVHENRAATITFPAQDADNDPLTYQLSVTPAHGTATVNAATGKVTYTPAADYAGTDEYALIVSDGNGGVASLTVPVTVVEEEKLIVACVGDSITYGLCASDRDATSYPARLQQQLGQGYHVENYGISSISLLVGADRDYSYGSSPYMQQSTACQPDIVILMLGTNDVHIVPSHPNDFKPAYKALIQTYQNLPSHPTVYAVNAPYWNNGSYDMILQAYIIPDQEAAAQETGCDLIDAHSLFASHTSLLSDGLHPNDDGYTLLAQTIAPYLLSDYGYHRAVMVGDVNFDGRINTADVRLILRGVIGKVQLTDEQRSAADVTGDGALSVLDVRKLLRYTVHKIDSLTEPK